MKRTTRKNLQDAHVKAFRKSQKPQPRVQVKNQREHWLQRAISLYIKQWAKLGVAIPADVRVTCGFPGGGSPTKRIGECWPRSRSLQGVNELFINPTMENTALVLDVLGHELVHAVDDCKNKHNRVFSRICAAVGYTGGRHAHVEAKSAREFQEKVAKRLGDYPHAAVIITKKQRNESSGLHKFTCASEGGDVLYSTAKTVENFGMPKCRCCGEEMMPAERKAKTVVTTI